METEHVESAEPKVEPKKKEVNWWQAIPTIITAFVAVIGIVVSCLTYLSANEDRVAQRLAARNERFTYAIEHLSSDSLAIRMGALFELKKLGLEAPELQENIVQILGPFIRDGIVDDGLLIASSLTEGHGMYQPNKDIFLACKIGSLFWDQSECSISLDYLVKTNIALEGIELRGANLQGIKLQDAGLWHANLQEANLYFANLQETSLFDANLQMANLFLAQLQEAFLGSANFQGANLDSANLQGANLQGAINLTAEQLLTAYIDDTTILDPDLRAEYDRLKAEQE
ncbi:MAG: pentapeptide repeat-containing protein [Oscillospiraceae bacterium]|nr:pentapeptide repeat-containing protein [Oscillospiraceae bacterium]